MIQLQKDEISFPDPAFYHPMGGLIAQGGDLSVDRVLLAYQHGIFPWYNPGEEILWWCPDPRFVLFPDELKISKSMRKIMAKDIFRFTENMCFAEVMQQCKNTNRKDQNDTWISDELIETFVQLHNKGIAKSVEVWQNDQLVGGFYGLQIGDVFCGESMFSHVSNASKAGFIYFVSEHQHELSLIDCQVYTDHLKSLGARMISKTDYLHYLKSTL